MCSNYPVDSVSWDDITTRFLPILNEREGLTNCRDGCYRLPTEAELKYATQGGSTTTYYWGDSDSPSTVDKFVWWGNNSKVNGIGQTHRVATKEPNLWGLHDTVGNVWEWTQNASGEHGEYQFLSGGSWEDIEPSIFFYYFHQNYSLPETKLNTYGFRLVRTLPRTE